MRYEKGSNPNKGKKKKDRSRLLKKIYGEINVTYIIFQMVPG